MTKPKVLVIVGATATGKSDLAVKIAKKFNGEIISADSRQVYKGLDIGSGKITKKEMHGVKHHLLDVADPRKQFSASDYKILGQKALQDILSRNKLPIIVGGTGFYIDVLAGKTILPDVPPNKGLRSRLSKKSTGALYKLLIKKDPRRAKTIDANNKARLIRALEIVEALGAVPSIKPVKQTNSFICIGINHKNLDDRIQVRLEKRLSGIIREVRRLHKSGLSWKRMYELGLEYRYVSLFVRGEFKKNEMLEKLYTEIRHYSKRQLTWFKRNKKIKWFEATREKDIRNYLSSTL